MVHLISTSKPTVRYACGVGSRWASQDIHGTRSKALVTCERCLAFIDLADGDASSALNDVEIALTLAKDVMRWELVTRDGFSDNAGIIFIWGDRCVLKGEPYTWPDAPPNTYDHTFRRWNPATDIAAAMEVVERFIADGWNIDMQYSTAMQLWRVDLHKPSAPEFASVLALTLPRALCLAALAATGGKE